MDDAAILCRELGAHFVERGWLSANAIIFPQGPGSTPAIIDTGYVSHAEQTIALVESLIDGQDLRRIVNTHLHSDHCGGNSALQQHWPMALAWIPEGVVEAATAWDHAALSYELTGQTCPRFAVAGELRDGCTINFGGRMWEMHVAPGHDMDALIFFEPRTRTLISGDALWEHRLAITFPEFDPQRMPGEGFAAARQALELIESLGPRWVMPGHGPMFSDVAGALRRSRERIDALEADPEKHILHSARALLMYHLLEVRQQGRAEAVAWMRSTPIYAAMTNQLGFRICGKPPLAEQAIDSLLKAGAVLACEDGQTLTVPDHSR